MGLGKVLDKFRTKSAAKNGAAEPDGNGEVKKKMKKIRSVRFGSKKYGHLPLSKPLQPAPKGTDEPPNYMKPTSSYDIRKEKKEVAVDSSTSTASKSKSTKISTAARALVKNSSLRIVRASVKKKKKNTVKSLQLKQGSVDSKAPDSVDKDKCDGDSATKVCTYSYCSLHGHNHGAVPSLKRFLSLKVQKSMKLRGYSSIEKKGGKEVELVEDVVNELFIEFHTKLQAGILQPEWGEQRSKEEIQIEDVIKRMNISKLEDQSDAGQLQESSSVASFEDCGDKNSELSMEEIQVINQFLEYIEKECQGETLVGTEVSVQAESEPANYKIRAEFRNDGGRSQSSNFANGIGKEYTNSQSFVEHPLSPVLESEKQIWATSESCNGEGQNEMEANLNNFASENYFKDEAVHAQLLNSDSSYGMDKEYFDGLQIQKVKVKDPAPVIPEQPLMKLNSRSEVKRSRWRRQSSKNRKSIKEFNPQPPRLLDLQAEPEREQVNLKHQNVDERKDAEEWMVDYALRKALRRITSVRKKKVPELVAAFETVLPQKV